MDGDGHGYVIVGTYQWDVSSGATIDGAGGAWVYFGSESAGLSTVPRQMRSDGSAPVAPLGLSDSPFAIRLRMTGRMPMGREHDTL